MVTLLKRFINWKYYVVFILIFSSIAIIFTNQVVLRDFPNSADEYAYYISAELFSEGMLSVESPENPDFFHFFHIINDGKYYGKYPPGWPFFLMFGVLIGIPMIVNLIFGILTIFLVYLIGRQFFSENVGRIAILLMAVSSFFIFNSASYFSHSSALFFLTLFCYIYLKNLISNRKLNWFFLGIILGISFNIRQLDTLAIAVCFFVHYIYIIIRNKKPLRGEIKNAAIFLLGFILLVGIFLLYNYLQTGNPFLMPFQKYDPYDKIGLKDSTWESIWSTFKEKIYKRSLNLNIWVPFCFVFMFAALFFNNKNKKEYAYLLISVFGSLLLVHFFYWGFGGNQYGPRYLYSASFAIFLLIAVGLEAIGNRFEKTFKWTLIILILLNLVFFINISNLFHGKVNDRMQIYDQVREEYISNAIVFLDPPYNQWCSGSMPALDLTRNGIHFNNPVLYVHNLEEKNSILVGEYPGRTAYIWNCQGINFQYIKFLDFWKTENINCSLTRIK
jgi:hypothetical protein